jgi:hypothetical protein
LAAILTVLHPMLDASWLVGGDHYRARAVFVLPVTAAVRLAVVDERVDLARPPGLLGSKGLGTGLFLLLAGLFPVRQFGNGGGVLLIGGLVWLLLLLIWVLLEDSHCGCDYYFVGSALVLLRDFSKRHRWSEEERGAFVRNDSISILCSPKMLVDLRFE